MKRNSGIYKLFWTNCDHYYIGQSICITARYKKHLRKLFKGDHENSRLQNVYNKYGSPEVEVLATCLPEELDQVEQTFIDQHFNNTSCCNLCPTASSTKGYKHIPESLKKIGEKSRQKVFTEEYRAKLRARKPNYTMLGKKHTEKAKRLMSERRKGVPKSAEHRKKIGLAHTGEKHYNYGKSLPESTREKLSAVLSGGSNPKARKAINMNTKEVFPCLKDAALAAGVNYSTAKSSVKRNPNYFLQFYNPDIHGKEYLY